MESVCSAILSAVPEAEQVISWNMPTFKLNGKTVIHFAGHKNHLGLYPFPEAIGHFGNRLQGYKTSKGGIQLPYNKHMPQELISDL